MGIGVSVFLLAVGAILTWAVHVTSPSGIDLHTVGVILMICGALGMVLSLAFLEQLGRVRRSRHGRAGPGDPLAPSGSQPAEMQVRALIPVNLEPLCDQAFAQVRAAGRHESTHLVSPMPWGRRQRHDPSPEGRSSVAEADGELEEALEVADGFGHEDDGARSQRGGPEQGQRALVGWLASKAATRAGTPVAPNARDGVGWAAVARPARTRARAMGRRPPSSSAESSSARRSMLKRTLARKGMRTGLRAAPRSTAAW
ncbi:MAG: DUF6458 family protein [Acidimicrobiales bacterium]